MPEPGEFRFDIQDLTPTTLPMRRLQEYLPHLVEIFGSEQDVHLLRVDEGSAIPCIYVKPPSVNRVQHRLVKIKSGSGSRKSYRAMDCLNELLAEDGTSAVLHSPYFNIRIEFPGNKQAKDPVIGPIAEATELQGELFQIGGRDETISLYLRHEDEVFICTASRDQGRMISAHLFRQVRVSGTGRWMRTKTGKWNLVSFLVASFKPLQAVGLTSAIEQLRSLGRELGISPDPVPINEED